MLQSKLIIILWYVYHTTCMMKQNLNQCYLLIAQQDTVELTANHWIFIRKSTLILGVMMGKTIVQYINYMKYSK